MSRHTYDGIDGDWYEGLMGHQIGSHNVSTALEKGFLGLRRQHMSIIGSNEEASGINILC